MIIKINRLLLINLQRHINTLESILLLLTKSNKKTDPIIIAATLKQNNPFCRGNFVTNKLKEKYATAYIDPVNKILVPKLVPICSKENCTP